MERPIRLHLPRIKPFPTSRIVSDLPISPDADYVYICENNTIYGTKYKKLPNTKGKTLVADVSSCFLSEPVDVSKYGLIYGGVQKNIGPAGMVIVIIRRGSDLRGCTSGNTYHAYIQNTCRRRLFI